MKKRFLTILLTLCMLFALVPAGAMAEGTDLTVTFHQSTETINVGGYDVPILTVQVDGSSSSTVTVQVNYNQPVPPLDLDPFYGPGYNIQFDARGTYDLDYWTTNPESSEIYDFTAPVTQNLDLYPVLKQKTATEEPDTTKTICLTFKDTDNNEVVGDTYTIDVPAEDTYINTSRIPQDAIPAGYEIADSGDIQFNGNDLTIKVRKIASDKTVCVLFKDADTYAVVGGTATLTVASDATCVNTSVIPATALPQGYEIGVTGDMQIENQDGADFITVYVRKVVTTKTVCLLFKDADTDAVVGGTATMTVASDATCVNTSKVPATALPQGYEIGVVGDMPIEVKDGVDFVTIYVRKAVATKTVCLLFKDADTDEVVGRTGTLTVDNDATYINTSKVPVTVLPEGYMIGVVGDMPIEKKNGADFVTIYVRKVPADKVNVNFYISLENAASYIVDGEEVKQVIVTVDADNDIKVAFPELKVADGFKLVGWDIAAKEDKFFDPIAFEIQGVADLAINGWIAITPVFEEISKPVTPAEPTVTPKPAEVQNAAAKVDEHPEIAQAIKDGTWGKTTAAVADPASTTASAAAAHVPQTSDSSNPILWGVAMLAALIALAAVVIVRRRSNKG